MIFFGEWWRQSSWNGDDSVISHGVGSYSAITRDRLFVSALSKSSNEYVKEESCMHATIRERACEHERSVCKESGPREGRAKPAIVGRIR